MDGSGNLNAKSNNEEQQYILIYSRSLYLLNLMTDIFVSVYIGNYEPMSDHKKLITTLGGGGGGWIGR